MLLEQLEAPTNNISVVSCVVGVSVVFFGLCRCGFYGFCLCGFGFAGWNYGKNKLAHIHTFPVLARMFVFCLEVVGCVLLPGSGLGCIQKRSLFHNQMRLAREKLAATSCDFFYTPSLIKRSCKRKHNCGRDEKLKKQQP